MAEISLFPLDQLVFDETEFVCDIQYIARKQIIIIKCIYQLYRSSEQRILGAVHMGRASPANRADSILSRLIGNLKTRAKLKGIAALSNG